MLTALNIEEHIRPGAAGLLSRLRRNRIRVEHLYCDRAAVKSVCYERHRGRVSWQTIDRFLKAERGRVLCPQGLSLPDTGGYRRFESGELNKRLCENAAIWLLREARCPEARVVLIDGTGEHACLCQYLVEYTGSLSVITAETKLYSAEADRILDETGAVIHISGSNGAFREADLIIAPSACDIDIRCPADTVILSGERHARACDAPVIFGYSFELPEKLSKMKPEYLGDMYFASALYSIAGVHELGSSVFRRCWDDRVLHTRASLLSQFKKRLKPSV